MSLYLILLSAITYAVYGLDMGTSGCPCLTSLGTALDQYKNDNGNVLYQDQYIYPNNYGNGCKEWDIDPMALQPYCGNPNGVLLPQAPEWCQDAFCYVDPTNCDLNYHLSGIFPESGLHYSYPTCGSESTFINWYKNSTDTSHSLSDLADLVENYVVSLVANLEIDNVELTDITTDCTYTLSCPCSSCSIDNATWASSIPVDFDKTIYVPSNSVAHTARTTCLATSANAYFNRLAGLEYTNYSNLAYLYAGFQDDASYIQWPAMQWCPSSYDPRFRPWYASSTANSKVAILVIDIRLAREFLWLVMQPRPCWTRWHGGTRLELFSSIQPWLERITQCR